MATLQEISEAIRSIESKKQTLKTAFEDLQKQSHSLSSFSLTWPQIDSHFSQIQSSLLSRFSLLQPSTQDQDPQTPPKSEIRTICEKMEAPKLMNWVNEHFNLKDEGIIELGQALKYAPDPFSLVLDALEGVDPKGKPNVVLLEGLMTVEDVNISVEVRERARVFALKWKEEMGDKPFEVLFFLSVVACYQLVEEFGKDDIVQLVHIAAKNAKTIKLCRALGLEEIVPDVIESLIKEGKRLMAFRYAFEFKPLEKFSPLELLQSYLVNAKKFAQQLRKKENGDPNSLNKADEREVNALRTVLRYIQDFKLESDYPPEPLAKRLKVLEKLRSNRKSKLPNIKQKKQNPSRRVGVNSVPQSHTQPQLPYAFSGSMPNAPLYEPGNLLHGLASVYANNPSSSHVYVPGSQVPSSSHIGHLPQHQPYRPQ